MNLPGINIQWPWSRLLIDGLKIVETRGYPIPQKYLGQPLALIETPGEEGKRLGLDARIIGTICFDSCHQYVSEDEWIRDFSRHLVPNGHSLFGWNHNSKKFAWGVSNCEKLRYPGVPPERRGIVFTTNCEIFI